MQEARDGVKHCAMNTLYSAEDAVVAPGGAMPRWGWDGLQT